MRSKECIAMILAGGQGSRLGVLTKLIAKPAVPFGGKYRIIDFALSNCYNSGIDTVGVLTQYKPLQLHTYIGIGSSWDLDRKTGGVFVLPPFEREKGGEWYKGTANAIYQNADFIDAFEPSYVLVLSGDHIYKMDYSLMLEHHKQQQADATIAVIEVPWEETHRFGIMNTDKNLRITEFEEKPRKAKSNLASMGVYIFNWQVLKRYLAQDESDPKSEHDFGKNVIPKMLKGQQNMLAYPFKSYWKDVGTVESLWEANMDLLADKPELDLSDDSWRIYSVNPTQPPHYIGPEAKLKASLVSEGCQIFGNVEHSVLFPSVEISFGAMVKDSVIMSGAKIGKDAVIENAIIGQQVVIEAGVHISGRREDDGKAKIALVEENQVVTKDNKYEYDYASL